MGRSISTRQFLEEKTFAFSLQMARLANDLLARKAEPIYVRQLMRSGTSVGANMAEATMAYSRAEVAAKTSIALKECRETMYWLRLLTALNVIPPEEFAHHVQAAEEISKILYKSIQTLRTPSST